MEATLETKMTISGSSEEIMKTIEAIMMYQYESLKADYYFGEGAITINNSRMELQKDLISDYLKSTGEQIQDTIIIEMDGPYGEFDNLSEISFFEELSDEFPSITFSGSFVAEETYSYESVECNLVNNELHISKYYENYEDLDENYQEVVKNKLPYDGFIKLLGIDTDDFGEDEYDEFIDEADEREHFLFDDYDEFSDFFPSLEITESQYDEMCNVIAKLGIDYNVCRENGECGDLIKYIYDPIEHKYYEEGQNTKADETRETPDDVFKGSIQVNPFLMKINGVNICQNTSLGEIKEAGLTEESLCIDEYENIRDYAVSKPVSVQGSLLFIVLRFVIENNETLLSGIRMILDFDNNDDKQKWTKSLVFALNSFGRPYTQSVSEVTFLGGEVEMSRDYDFREEESEEMVPIINYWGPSEEDY